MTPKVIQLSNVLPRIYGMEFPAPINWTICKNEQWCVVGPNGAGKTMLADLLVGKYAVKSGSIDYLFCTTDYQAKTNSTHPLDSLRKVSFESAYLLSDYKNMYYQQRFHALENEFTPTVEELLSRVPDNEYVKWLCQRLHVDALYGKHLIMLSSGELRRLLIVLALAKHPALIIFDNPFIGLDVETRKELDAFLVELSAIQQMIFLVPALNEIPQATTHILKADALHYEVVERKSIEISMMHKEETDKVSLDNFPLFNQMIAPPCQYVLKMNHISISYNHKPLFDDLNWTIRQGEKWALIGQNGSGKSTLLSLLAADNPRGYSLDLTIFDKRRGTGESIWDIKRPIGYISSEMHLYFREDQSCLRIVGSGLFDTIGLFRKCTPEQEDLALQWMRLLQIDYLKDRSFLKISGGEQRLVLLARTMVKNPDLLILDEPLHGLDMVHKKRCRQIIEHYCTQPGKTMIYVTHRKEEIPSCVNHFFELKKLL